MAMEVMQQGYLYHLAPPVGRPVRSAVIEPDAPLFCHDPIHDAESLWWTAAWFLVRTRPPTISEDTGAAIELSDAQKAVVNNFFPPQYNERTNVSCLFWQGALIRFALGLPKAQVEWLCELEDWSYEIRLRFMEHQPKRLTFEHEATVGVHLKSREK